MPIERYKDRHNWFIFEYFEEYTCFSLKNLQGKCGTSHIWGGKSKLMQIYHYHMSIFID